MQVSQLRDADRLARSGQGALVGRQVRMRGERWQVTSVRAYDSCELLTLLGIEPSNAGRVQRVLTPFEDVVPIDVRSPITPVCARRWWRVCRDLIANDGSSAMLWSARTARMELLPHQLHLTQEAPPCNALKRCLDPYIADI